MCIRDRDEAGDRNLAVFINANVENVVCIGLVLEPCAAVRDYGSGEQNLVGLVKLPAVVYARGTNELRYDRAFCTVDDEGRDVYKRQAFLDILYPDTLGCTAVVLTDDNVLRNVYQTAGQVTRVSGTQCGICLLYTSRCV